MNYYKIPKKQLQDFYELHNIENDTMPSKIIPQNEFNLIRDYIYYNIEKFENIINDIEKYENNINSYFSYNNKNIEKNIKKFLPKDITDKKVSQYMSKLQKPSLNLEDLQLLTKFISTINNENYGLLEFKNNLSKLLIFNYVLSKQKYQNLQAIVDYANSPQQISLVEINFENQKNNNSINNLDSLNQIYSSYYNPHITDLIVASNSQIYNIEISLGITPITVTENEAFKIFLSHNGIINFDDILESSFTKQSVVIAPVRNPDMFEKTIQKIRNIESPVTITEFFPMFTICLETLISLEVIDKYKFGIFSEIKNHLLTYQPEDIEPLYIKYIKNSFEKIDSNILHYNILKTLSPNSKFIGQDISLKLSKSFNDQILTELNSVQAAFFYISFLKEDQINNYSINLNESKTQCNYSFSTQTKKQIALNITQGTSLSLKNFEFNSVHGKQAVENLINKVSQQDEQTYKDFNSSNYFIKLQKDIYPLLSFKEKVNYNNYSCFEKDGLEGVNFLHIDSLPISMWYNEKIFELMMQYYGNIETVNLSSAYSHNNLISNYFAPLFYEVFTKVLEDDCNQKRNFSYIKHLDIFSKDNLKPFYFYEQINNDKNITTTIKNLCEQYVMSNSDSTKEMLKFFAPHILNSKCKKPEYFQELKEIYYLLPEIFQENQSINSNFLKAIASDPNFDINDANNKKIILNSYKKNNGCINKKSLSVLIQFLLSPDVLSEIISHHKLTNTKSSCKGFEAHNGLKNLHFSDCIISKNKLKDMLHFNFDLLYLSPSLLKYLPEKTLNNEKDWEKSIKKIFSLENSDNNFFLPKTITNNYEIFSAVYEEYMNLYTLDKKNQKFLTNLQKCGSIIGQFPHIFLNKEEEIIKTLKFLSINYDSSVCHNFISGAKNINESFSSFITNVKNSKYIQVNPFEQTLLIIEHMSMNKKIEVNNGEKVSKPRKF